MGEEEKPFFTLNRVTAAVAVVVALLLILFVGVPEYMAWLDQKREDARQREETHRKLEELQQDLARKKAGLN